MGILCLLLAILWILYYRCTVGIVLVYCEYFRNTVGILGLWGDSGDKLYGQLYNAYCGGTLGVS